MLRLSKMTDYGTLLLAQMAQRPDAVHTATELSEATHVGAPTVSKLLKQLTRGGLLTSQRGANGGYSLARAPQDISAADIIDAIEGNVGITECSTDHSNCELEASCNVGSAWQRINIAIRDALHDVTLLELARPSQLRAPEVRLTGSLKNIPIKVE
jgi:FeS assembly SUF system regulator